MRAESSFYSLQDWSRLCFGGIFVDVNILDSFVDVDILMGQVGHTLDSSLDWREM